jgi:Cu+-exporting ATPase
VGVFVSLQPCRSGAWITSDQPEYAKTSAFLSVSPSPLLTTPVLQVRCVVFDKTGTLTVGRPTVTASKVFAPHRLEDVLALAAAAEAHSEHPLGTAILADARHVSQSHSTMVASSSSDVTDTSWLQRADEFEAVPGQGVRAKVAGQEILVGNRRMMQSHGVHVPLGAEEALQSGEQRARTGVMVAVNRELAAVLAISDPLKAEAPAVVQALKRMGIRSVMMTGDNADTARVVAEEVRPPGRS